MHHRGPSIYVLSPLSGAILQSRHKPFILKEWPPFLPYNVSIKMWGVLHCIWKHRCDKLHATDELARMSGLAPLKTAIAKEYGLGIGQMPHLYSSFFHSPLQHILKRGVNYLKKWFRIIRTSREANTLVVDIDDFLLMAH